MRVLRSSTHRDFVPPTLDLLNFAHGGRHFRLERQRVLVVTNLDDFGIAETQGQSGELQLFQR
jgi:hypothetical protein